MADPYVDGAWRWWHLSDPSPELIEAQAQGWLGAAGRVIDIGCGLGTEIAYLAARGWDAVGVDLTSRGTRNQVTEAAIRAAFTGWVIERLGHGELPSDTRTMPALVVRLRRD